MFGAELGLGERLTISGKRLAVSRMRQRGTVAYVRWTQVFSYTGCAIEVDGQSEMLYESKDTPMQYYLNLHHVLDARRLEAKESGKQGPSVMIVSSWTRERTGGSWSAGGRD